MAVPDVEAQGFRVPALGYGTWRLEGPDCRDGVAHALAVGYRHIDTAQMYGNEEEVGQALAASSVPRDQVWLTTKVTRGSLAEDAVKQAGQESLRRLGVDYVDLLLIHWPSDEAPLAETIGAMSELRDAGVTRAIGVSNFPSAMLREAHELGPVLTDQVEYHPYLGQPTLLETCAELDVFLTAYAPLARGRVLDDPVLADIADGHGATPAQVAIAWALAQDGVATIPKATAPERIESNFRAVDVELTPAEFARVSGLDEGPDGRLVQPPFAPAWDE